MDDGLHRRHHVSFNETTDGLGVENKPKYASSTNKPNVKPAIKQQVSLLPPAERYQHPDPLLRRLRLRDGHGEPVNLRQMFSDTKLVLFYFSSQWNAQENRGCHRVRVFRVTPHADYR